jgi:uncharacterized membrane protein
MDYSGLLGVWLGCGALLIFLSIGVVILFVKGFFKAAGKAQERVMTKYQDNATRTDALTLLNKRLAQGEITEEEYRRLHSSLERNI